MNIKDQILRNYVYVFLIFPSFSSMGQAVQKEKVAIGIDTTKDGKGYRMFGAFPNKPDKAAILCDKGFKGDTLTIMINDKLVTKEVLTTGANGYTTEISFPKSKKMLIAIKLNSKTYEPFEFNQSFCVAHLTYKYQMLLWTYTNKIYAYE